jgi:hypothetical protein
LHPDILIEHVTPREAGASARDPQRFSMPLPPPSRPWWRSPGPLLALLLHGVIFLGLFELHFPDGEWDRMQQRIGPAASTGRWFQELTAAHGWGGVVVWFFDTHNEIRLYHRYAEIAWRGFDPALPADAPGQGSFSPYRDVAVEYQPGALLVMLPPAFFARDLEGYQIGFVAWCGMLYTGALLLGLALLGDGTPVSAAVANRALWWSVAFLLCFGGVAAARFDHAVPLVCVVALGIFRRADRADSAGGFAAFGAVAAVGVLVKIVPGVLVPAGLLWLARPGRPVRWRPAVVLAGSFFLTLGLLHAAAWVHWGEGYVGSYRYHLDRGLQLESIYAGVIAAGHGLGHPLSVLKRFGAYELVTPLVSFVKPLSLACLVAAFAAVAGRFWFSRAGERFDRERALLLLTVLFLLGFILTNKVFSPQYLLWLAPLLAAAYGWRPRLAFAAGLFLLAAALSQAIFPRFYDQLTGLQPALVAVLNLRNAALLLLFGWLLWRLPALLEREGNGQDQ